jgi:hypothetical protein
VAGSANTALSPDSGSKAATGVIADNSASLCVLEDSYCQFSSSNTTFRFDKFCVNRSLASAATVTRKKNFN